MLSPHTVVAGWRFIGDALVEPTPEDSGSSDDCENGDFRDSDAEAVSECGDPRSDGMIRGWDRRLSLARRHGTRHLPALPQLEPDFHELSPDIDDEEGFLAAEQLRLAEARRTRWRGLAPKQIPGTVNTDSLHDLCTKVGIAAQSSWRRNSPSLRMERGIHSFSAHK
jgi:hypothetical protein